MLAEISFKGNRVAGGVAAFEHENKPELSGENGSGFFSMLMGHIDNKTETDNRSLKDRSGADNSDSSVINDSRDDELKKKSDRKKSVENFHGRTVVKTDGHEFKSGNIKDKTVRVEDFNIRIRSERNNENKNNSAKQNSEKPSGLNTAAHKPVLPDELARLKRSADSINTGLTVSKKNNIAGYSTENIRYHESQKKEKTERLNTGLKQQNPVKNDFLSGINIVKDQKAGRPPEHETMIQQGLKKKPRPSADKESSRKEIHEEIVSAIKIEKKIKTNQHSTAAEKKNNDTEHFNITKSVQVNSDHNSKSNDFTGDLNGEHNHSKERGFNREVSQNTGFHGEISGKGNPDRLNQFLKLPDFRQNLQEIIDKAKIVIRDSRNGSFTVKLNPKELGEVNVSLSIENGVLKGRFLVANDDVRAYLADNFGELKSHLRQAGIEVGEFSVNVRSDQRRFQESGDSGGKDFFRSSTDVKDSSTAADVYGSNAIKHNGYINMVI